MSRVIDNSSDPFHRKSIRTALRAWNNVQKLGTHPLAKLAIVQKRQQEANRPNAVSNLGLSLRDVLRSAIEELRADAGEPAIDDPSWRPYIILKEEYIEGRAAEYLAVQFGELPLRTYQGWRAKALDSLADILRQWEDDQQLTTVVTPQLPAVAERRQGTNGYQTESSYGTLLVNEPLATITPIQGLDQVPVAELFYGRENELATLNQWLVADRCRVVAILGMGGQGKTTLASTLCRNVAPYFEYVIWKSLLNAPLLDEILRSWLRTLSNQQILEPPERLDEQLGLLAELLRNRRCLLILDNAESIMQSGDSAGSYAPGYAEYGQLIRFLGESQHQGCLLLTSREEPHGFSLLARAPATKRGGPVRSLILGGLDEAAAHRLLTDDGLSGSVPARFDLLQRYSGNPLALMLVSKTILEMFGGNIDAFLVQEITVFDDIRDVLQQQFDRLNSLEQSILFWLAIEREAIAFSTLWDNLSPPKSTTALLETLRSLQRRSLLAVVPNTQGDGNLFHLQNVVLEFVTERLIELVCEEIERDKYSIFKRHALIKATAKEYVRVSQERAILRPISQRLQAGYHHHQIKEKLQKLLDELRGEPQEHRLPSAAGPYAAGNTLNLLLYLGADIEGLDLSHLPICQAYLSGKSLCNVNFAYAQVSDSIFNDTFGSIASIAFHPSGRILASGTNQGEIRLWQTRDGQPIDIIQGHAQFVRSVIFNVDGDLLYSADAKGAIRSWNVVMPETQEQTQPQVTLHPRYTIQGTDEILAIALSPDEEIIASACKTEIHLWCRHTQQMVGKSPPHPAIIRTIAFHPNGRFLVSGCNDHKIRFWKIHSLRIEGEVQPTNSLQTPTITVDQNCAVWSLAFSATGSILVSAGRDNAIQVWSCADILRMSKSNAGGKIHPQKVLHGHTNRVNTITISPDDTLLASGSADRTIGLWDLQTGQLRNVLSGHTGEILAAAFSPDGHVLASGSNDKTSRLWDIQSGRSLLTLRGMSSPSASSIAFSPSGHTLASGGDDGFIRIWSVETGQEQKAWKGHTGLIFALRYSPDGTSIASAGIDRMIRLWDVQSGTARHTLVGHKGEVTSVAFSPDDAKLVSGSDDRTIRLWDVNTASELASWQSEGGSVWAVAFNPDGKTVATSHSNGCVYLWDVQTGEILHCLANHSGLVWTVDFSRDGKMLASGGWDGQVCLWNAQTGALKWSGQGHSNWVKSVAFHYNCGLLASADYDGIVCLWNTQSGEVIDQLQGGTAVAFSPTTDVLAISTESQEIRFWDTSLRTYLHKIDIQGMYAGMNIRGISGITEAQKQMLQRLGAIS